MDPRTKGTIGKWMYYRETVLVRNTGRPPPSTHAISPSSTVVDELEFFDGDLFE